MSSLWRPLARAKGRVVSVGLAVVVVSALGAVAARGVRSGPVLRVDGRRLVDGAGRTIILRGVNLSGDAKVPPFAPITDPRQLDPLPGLGFNAIRLVFIWEAYEPVRGRYDEAYLGRLVAIAREAWARGMVVVIDVHQDGFSRYAARGCGSGFPAWAISPRARVATPDNGCDCRNWVFKFITDPNFHKSLQDFYADVNGVRTSFLVAVGRMAAAFADVPGVIGYDLINEPWGHEVNQLAPLERDEAAAIRAGHPTAILLVEGHGSTSTGNQTRLPAPPFGNAAYAPHYYLARAIAQGAWYGATRPIDRAFARMEAKAAEWCSPLIIGEFGIGATDGRAGDYVAAVYERIDAVIASAFQWNYTPGWTPARGDGWNTETFSILDDRGLPRATLRPRPQPRAFAGMPVLFRYQAPGPAPARVEFVWDHQPGPLPTEVFAPTALFPAGSSVAVDPPDAAVTLDPARQVLFVDLPRPARVRVVLTAPIPVG